MFRKISSLVVFGCFLMWGSTIMSAQCGSSFKLVIHNCGSHCGSFGEETCEGVGTLCENGTGEPGSGCCGFQFFNAGDCVAAKGITPRELLPSKEFLTLRDTLALRKTLFPSRDQIMIVSCAPDKNAFNDWLQAKLRQQQGQR